MQNGESEDELDSDEEYIKRIEDSRYADAEDESEEKSDSDDDEEDDC